MYEVAAYYHFTPLEHLDALKERLMEYAAACPSLNGLVLLAPEGLNATVAGVHDELQRFVGFTRELLRLGACTPKISTCEFKPFRRFKVDLRKEIITLTGSLDPALIPSHRDYHLSPEEWHETLSAGGDHLLIDTRNSYETAVGIFRNAIDPKISRFSEFPAYIAQSAIPKNKKVLLYCTGGIRCEKAVLEMRRQGYSEVYQLEGGILSYLERFPDQHFDGECFVFDHRVALDQNLAPSQRFKLCPLCGDPAETRTTCAKCGSEAILCGGCRGERPPACSKNCAHHLDVRATSQKN
jgi:UPF0176 protein